MANRKRIEVLYFAMYRELKRRSTETVESSAASPRALYVELGLDQILPFDAHHLRVAVNDEFASWDSVLQEGDRVAFIAPVAGG
jgi:molybdopterin converting factor small subunit